MGDAPGDVAAVRDELAIRRLLADYCHLCDDGDFAALAQTFAPDGSVVFGGRTTTGREALVRWFEGTRAAGRRGKHITANAAIDVDGDRATAVSDYVYFEHVDGVPTPYLAGRYDDELRRVAGGWLFQRRTATTMGAAT